MDKKDNRQIYYNVFQDWRANAKNPSGRIIMLCFRVAKWTRSSLTLTILFFWYFVIYKACIEWLTGVEISLRATLGRGLRLESGRGTMIDNETVIGVNCTIRQLTTIGRKKLIDNTFSSPPVIGDRVDIGVNVTVIGNIDIGNNVVLGAGTVITKSVSDNSVMVGNPARLLKKVYDFPGFEDHERKIAEVQPNVSLLDRV
ncbi:MAG: serine acetyltransferase [Pedobacter sp.]|nr:MAG: serine acetyltransferase [Pedobacter sp.]